MPLVDDLDDEDYVETESPTDSDDYEDSGSASDYSEGDLTDDEDGKLTNFDLYTIISLFWIGHAHERQSKSKRSTDIDDEFLPKRSSRTTRNRNVRSRSGRRQRTKTRHRRSESSHTSLVKQNTRSSTQAELVHRWKEYLPTDWIFMTHQPPTPYHPQVGDEIVYFRQGHEEFLKNLDSEFFGRNLPWDQHPGLNDTVFGMVTHLDFQPGIPPYCTVSIITESSQDFRVNYFDRIGVSDFIILRSRYEQGTRRRWRSGMHCKAFFDDQLYSGDILGKEPLDVERFPDSPWGCLLVSWEGDDPAKTVPDRLSPWELYLPGTDESAASRPGQTLDQEGQ